MKTLIIILLGWTVTGCDIFLTKGGEGQPCLDSNACHGDLVCNFDECVPPLSRGESCDDYWLHEERYAEENVCKEGLICVRERCQPMGKEGEACVDGFNEPFYNSCEEDLGCVDGHCAEVGGEGEPCYIWKDKDFYSYYYQYYYDDECDPGLSCRDGICVD